MLTMEPIGGYFELELRKGEHFHNNALRLNTARNCFEFVLRARNCKTVYIPYYTCEAMLEPILKLGIGFQYYHINDMFEPISLPVLGPDEVFLYTNYFGLKQDCVRRLANHYGKQLIIDNAQAFYAKPLDGIDTFYSARKFFGVADGAFLFSNKRPVTDIVESDVSYDRMSHLLKRIDLGAEAGFMDFRGDEALLAHQEIKYMSRLTESILLSIDFETIKNTRRHNYSILDKALRHSNQLHLIMDDEAVPMVYPYISNELALKQRLVEEKVFVATYWPNVIDWCKGQGVECTVTEKASFLPIDQRYGEKEMTIIADIINQKTR